MVDLPKLNPGQIFRCYKISKRFDQDISSVMGAFLFSVEEDGRIGHARIAYGGMAGIPKRATGAERARLSGGAAGVARSTTRLRVF